MIDKAINRVLAQPIITWSVANNRYGVYGVRIGSLKTKILILLTPSTEKYGYFDIKVSHTIKTPLQTRPRRPKWRCGRSKVDALRRSIRDIICQYCKATAKSFKPGEDWLIWQR